MFHLFYTANIVINNNYKIFFRIKLGNNQNFDIFNNYDTNIVKLYIYI